jgi:hypothetical protein
MSSCPYANIIGAPGTGYYRQWRVFGISIVDTIVTFFVFAVPSAWFFKGNVWIHFIIWLVIGEIFHYLFGVQTAVMDKLGIVACPDG